MALPSRHTIVAHGRMAMRQLRLQAAREGLQGRQVMTFEQLAARLAGGFCKAIDDETLRTIIQAALPGTALGELETIKMLPGMVDAAAETLRKVWRSGIDLAGRSQEHARLEAVGLLEAAVLERLPTGMMRPADLVSAACARLEHAEAVLGPIEIVGITELSPCWRPLLLAIAEMLPVTWTAGPRTVPEWVVGTAVDVRRSAASAPSITAIGAATSYHEAIEAVRWVRRLIASGVAPADIAIASAVTADHDGHFVALRADANLDLHFVHGIPVATTHEGQAAAALADILVRGVSQTRVRRLARACRSDSSPFGALPTGWTGVLPVDAPLASAAAWLKLIETLSATDWPDGVDYGPELRAIVDCLSKGHAAADEVGAFFLSGRSFAIWRKALLAGPWSALDRTLEVMRQDDGLEACVSAAWMPASALAATPRRFVRLIGLNSSRWPRGISEDRLIPDHVVPTDALEPLPAAAADRRDFDTIIATTTGEVVLSRARRDADGRLLGRSPLLDTSITETYIARNAVPVHAFSETDRLIARPSEFSDTPEARSALSCWRDWHRREITAHDGLVRADHPVMRWLLDRTHSASSLRLLLRNPVGFVWRYGLRLRAPESGAEPLVLDAAAFGDLVHAVLDVALRRLEDEGGFADADPGRVQDAVAVSTREAATLWEAERAVPPAQIWRRTLDDVRSLSLAALMLGERLPGGRSFGEVAFGGAAPKADAMPWDPRRQVAIPGTELRISGYIDRLDLSADGSGAVVKDYKTGRIPKGDIELDGGRELQRCLYAFAVKAMLGDEVEIGASLVYPRNGTNLTLADPEATLQRFTGHLEAACTNLTAGRALLGPDTGDAYDRLAFALPANAGAAYCKRKFGISAELLGDAALVWEAQ